eukprot:jgi/Chlat1/505/Chrsp103S00987
MATGWGRDVDVGQATTTAAPGGDTDVNKANNNSSRVGVNVSLSQKPPAQARAAAHVLNTLIDSILLDIAIEHKRDIHAWGDGGAGEAGSDSEEAVDIQRRRTDVEPRKREAETASGRGCPDVFGQWQPAVATDLVTCRGCGQKLAAGRFAPHLEKCMVKARREPKPVARYSHAPQHLSPEPSHSQGPGSPDSDDPSYGVRTKRTRRPRAPQDSAARSSKKNKRVRPPTTGVAKNTSAAASSPALWDGSSALSPAPPSPLLLPQSQPSPGGAVPC